MIDFIKYTEKEEFYLLKQYLEEIQNNKSNFNNCKGIIVRGDYGIGKTTFIKKSLKELNYEIIEYDHTQSGSKNIENLFYKQSSKESIINIFNKKKTKIVILIDNLECINKNERGTLGEILKYTRGKKTKTQKNEEYSLNPVICISNNGTEKKINDIASKIYNINYQPISNNTIKEILKENKNIDDETLLNKLTKHVNHNLYELNNIINISDIKNIISFVDSSNCFYVTKEIVNDVIKNNYDINYHNEINETDRTSIGLLYHENIIDSYKGLNEEIYIGCLKNFCYSDYIDRITFQKQIWSFNEMSSIIKIINNNYLLQHLDRKKKSEIRFTKVLTKYSTEYNNKIFLIKLSQKNNSDIDELFMNVIQNENLLNDNITDLELNRLKKYLTLSE